MRPVMGRFFILRPNLFGTCGNGSLVGWHITSFLFPYRIDMSIIPILEPTMAHLRRKVDYRCDEMVKPVICPHCLAKWRADPGVADDLNVRLGASWVECPECRRVIKV
jgi:hypothetical protein